LLPGQDCGRAPGFERPSFCPPRDATRVTSFDARAREDMQGTRRLFTTCEIL